MLLPIVLTLLTLYILFIYYGVVYNPFGTEQSGGGDDGNGHLKLVFENSVINDMPAITVHLYNSSNVMIDQRGFNDASALTDYVNKIRSSGKAVYTAMLQKHESDADINAVQAKFKDNPELQKRFQELFSVLWKENKPSCGQYRKDTSIVYDTPQTCTTFPQSYNDLVKIPAPAVKRDLSDILKELGHLQLKPITEPDNDIKRALELAQQLKEKDDAASRRVYQVRNERRELNQRLDEAKENRYNAKTVDADVLKNYDARLEKVESKLYDIGRKIHQGHAMLETIKGKLENDAKPSSGYMKLNEDNNIRDRIDRLANTIRDAPKCPVCPLYSETHPVNVVEVTNQGFGSIVKDTDLDLIK